MRTFLQDIPVLIVVVLFLLQGWEIRSFDASLSRQRTNIQYQLQYKELPRSKISLEHYSGTINRRDVFGVILSIPSLLLAPRISSAVTSEQKEQRPFAPLETLLPAIRVKISIDQAFNLTNLLIANTSSTNKVNSKTLEQLEDILLKPQDYVKTLTLQGVPQKPANLYLNSYKPMKGDLPFQRFIVQNGDVNAWKRLKKSEKVKERRSEILAALNAYTDALSFSADSYLLNVDKATQSSMVREDRLPDVKQVITSDMGMRYLYRNQVLTTMDDVKAEFEYQLSHVERDGFDGSELLELLALASKAMDRWLSLVNPNDVLEAFEYTGKYK